MRGRTLVALWLVLATASSALADVRTEARRHFRRGMQLIGDGEIDEGIAELEQAYETLPHPNVLYNIARAYAESDRYEEAIESFELYLESDPPDREEVEGFLAALRARIQATQEPASAPEPEETPASEERSALTEEELAAIEESAGQIETLAEATQSDALRHRAEQLRALAESLSRRSAAPPPQQEPLAPTLEPSSPEPEETTGESPSDDDAEGFGASRVDVFEEEIVSASRFAESPLDAPNSTSIITRQDIRLTGLTDVSQLLRRIAGVEVMSNFPSQTDVSIRGLNRRQSNKVLVLVDGRSVRLDFLAAPWVQMLPFGVEDIERIEVIRGPAAAVYGADAFSGIINIILRNPGSDAPYVRVGGGNHGQARAVGSISADHAPLRFRISGGYERYHHYAEIIAPDREDISVSDIWDDPRLGLERAFVNGELRLDLGNGHALRAGSAISSGDGTIQGISRLRQTAANDVLLSQTHITLTTAPGIMLRSYWNRFQANVDPYEQPPGALRRVGDVRQDIVDTELSFNRTLQLGVPQTVGIGVGHRFKNVAFNWFAEDQTEHHLFAYLQDAIELHETLRLTLSLRVDRHPLLDGPQISPRGSVVWRFLPGNSLRFVAGTAFRSPSFTESYLSLPNRTPIRGVTAIGLGNQNLDPERIVSFELGYMNQATDYFALELNGYYNRVFDEIQLKSVNTFDLMDTGAGAGGYIDDIAAFSVGTLRFDNDRATFGQLGAELGVRAFPVDGLDVYANYAIHDTSPIGEAQSSEVATDQRTSLHKVNVGVQYRSSFGLDLSADLHWVSSQLWVEQVTDATRGVRFEAFPLNGYAMLNARIGYRFFDDRLEVDVTGFNLTGQKQRQHPFGQPLDTRVMASVTARFE